MNLKTTDHRNLAPLAVAFEVAIAVVAVAAGRLLGPMPLETIDPAWSEWRANLTAILWGVAGVIPLAVGLVGMQRTKIPSIRRLQLIVDRQIVPLFADTTIVELALVSVAAGLGEEMLFRGWLQPAVAELWGESGNWIGLVVASVLFGVVHWVNRAYAVLAGLVGLYLGLLFLWTDNLLAPVVTHGLYDFVALIYLVRFRKNEKSGGLT